MTTQIPEYQRKTRTKLLEQMIQDYDAVNSQLADELSALHRNRLERQAGGLKLEIEQLRRELGLTANEKLTESPSETDKGDGKTTASPKTVYGQGSRWAVLVGVNVYEDKNNYGRLHVCVSDVTTIRDRLVAGGCDPDRIRLLTDDTPNDPPTRAKIINALQVVANATKPDDLLLFYYSGHGDELEGESYLVSRDGHRASLADTGVPVSRIEEIMQKAKARAKVIVLDACHSGVDFEGKKGTPQPLSPEFIKRVYEQAKGIAILASCEQGQVSYEWVEEGCSAFTYYVREALAGKADFLGKGFVSVDDVHKYTLNELEKWATKRSWVQAPTLESRVEGDIILSRYKLSEAG
jgi:hypothetical protein